MKGKIIITVINAIKDIAIAIFNVFHKKSKSSTEPYQKKNQKHLRQIIVLTKLKFHQVQQSLRLSLLIKQSLLTDL